ncbi:hypothetical protein FKM82_027168 [Ascaphus truei]
MGRGRHSRRTRSCPAAITLKRDLFDFLLPILRSDNVDPDVSNPDPGSSTDYAAFSSPDPAMYDYELRDPTTWSQVGDYIIPHQPCGSVTTVTPCPKDPKLATMGRLTL